MHSKRLTVVFPLYEEKQENYILLGRHIKTGLRNGPGGKCEDGESYNDCAIRETQSETSDHIQIHEGDLKKLGDKYVNDIIITFFAVHLDEKIIIPDGYEMKDFKRYKLIHTHEYLFEMFSGDDKIIQNLIHYTNDKDNYQLFSIDESNNQKLIDQTKTVFL